MMKRFACNLLLLEVRVLIRSMARTVKIRNKFLVHVDDQFQIRHQQLGLLMHSQRMSSSNRVFDLWQIVSIRSLM